MNKYNVVILTGFVGKNPQFSYTKQGLPYLRFTLSTLNDVRAKAKKSYSWHKCIIWGKLAESVNQYCVERARCIVQGSYVTNTYEKDGTRRFEQQVKVDTINFTMPELSEEAATAAREGRAMVEEHDQDNQEDVVV